MGAGFSGFIVSAKCVEKNVVIDGCPVAAGKNIRQARAPLYAFYYHGRECRKKQDGDHAGYCRPVCRNRNVKIRKRSGFAEKTFDTSGGEKVVKDKKTGMAVIGIVVLVIIVIAIWLMPVFGSITSDNSKKADEIARAYSTAEAGAGLAAVSGEDNNLSDSRRVDSGAIKGQAESMSDKEAKVTFIELGSVKCIPCKMMQPVMKSIEEKYKNVVQVVFYDVWTPEGEPYAKEYGINSIPTQVFKDKKGTEYFRHIGYFPLAEVEKIIKQQL
jgi:thioredoxin 1